MTTLVLLAKNIFFTSQALRLVTLLQEIFATRLFRNN